MPSWKKVLISGSDAALNTLNVTTALTASGLIYPTVDGTPGQAIVTDGTGSLSFTTIVSGTGATTKLNQSIAAMTWSFAHNLNEQYPVVTIYDSNDEVIIPEKIDAVDANNLAIYFSTARIGRAVAVVGGTTVSASLSQTASYVEYGNVVNKPTLISGSEQIATDISGSFTSISSSIAGDIEDIIDGTTLVTSASYALTASFAENFIANSITASIISASYIDLDPTPDGSEPAWKEGRIFYSAENGALTVYNSEADITLQVGQEFWKKVKNGSASTILNGTPVRISGSTGDNPLAFPATAPDHITGGGIVYENHIIGIATHDIVSNAVGYITEKGVVNGLDTSNFSSGDILYLQTGSPATPTEYYTNTPPPFPYDIVRAGVVIRSHASAGSIEVSAAEPIHFGNISGLSGSASTSGELWIYEDGVKNAWAPGRTLSGSYVINGGGLTANSFTGSLLGTASYANNADLLDGLNSSQFLRNDQSGTLTGDLTVTGTITAQEFHTELVSSSILYESGSTKFGDSTDDTHSFTGSLLLSGSTVSLNVAWPDTGSEYHLLKTDAFTVSSSYGERTYNYAAIAMEHFEEDLQYEHNAFKIYMYDQDGTPEFGTNLLIGPYRAHLNIEASGSDSIANVSVRDLGTGETQALLYGTEIQLGVYNTERVYIGNTTSSLNIYSNGTQHTGSIDITGSVTVNGTLDIKSANVSYQENIDVDFGATEVVATISSTLYTAAFFDYVVKQGTNLRAGTITAVHDGTNIEYTDVATQDLGSTTGITLACDLSGGDIRLTATTIDDNWSVKAIVRAL